MVQAMSILKLKTKFSGDATTISAFLDGGLHREIFYEFSGDVKAAPETLGDCAVVAFLPYAMRHGLDLSVLGEVGSDLLEKLDECQDAWVRWHPSVFRRINIDAEHIRHAALPKDRSAVMAFSGGLDATYALHAHKQRLIGRRSLDIQAGVLVHGFDLPLDQPEWFNDAKRRAAAILDRYDAQLVTVRTNWRTLDLPWGRTFIFAVASVMHQFGRHFSHGVIAADEAYDGEVLGWGSNSITNQMISGVSFPIHFTGAGKSRTEKATALSREPVVLEQLRVCWERPESLGNCGICEKCIRTKLNFMANGVINVPTLGAPATPGQVRGVDITSDAVLNLFRELEARDWSDHPEIKLALTDLVGRGLSRPSKVVRLVKKYQRSLRKRLRAKI